MASPLALYQIRVGIASQGLVRPAVRTPPRELGAAARAAVGGWSDADVAPVIEPLEDMR
jgi:hypothetical protein